MQAYFKAQLNQYLDWLDRRGLSKNALADGGEELLDHQGFMEIDSAYSLWLLVARFKRTMSVSDANRDVSLPRIATDQGRAAGTC